jgi:hypothetical protein
MFHLGMYELCNFKIKVNLPPQPFIIFYAECAQNPLLHILILKSQYNIIFYSLPHSAIADQSRPSYI